MIRPDSISAIVIEDESIIRKMLTHAVEALECDVAGTAGDGISGIALFDEARPDIVLLDIKMPGMDGVETLSHIREIDPNAYVVMVTSIDNDETIEDCMIAGARDYIRKDTPVNRIVARLEKHIVRLRDANMPVSTTGID